MSKPTPSNYYIINRVLSPTGDKLAITSNGQEKTVTLTALTNLASQQWVIVNYSDGANQSVSPMEAQNLQCGPSGAVIAVLPYNSYVYWIRGGGGAPYTIHGGNNGAVGWSVATATDGAQVAWGPQTGYQEWILQPI